MPVDPARFDRAVLDRLRCEIGDEDATSAFVRSYLDLLDERVGALRAAAAAGDTRRLWVVAASLEVTSTLVGAARLAGWCREVVGRTGSDGRRPSQDDLVELDRLVNATAVALRGALGE